MCSGSNHGTSTFDDSDSFNDVLQVIFPETKDNRELRRKLHSQALNEYDQKNDQTLQINEFVEFVWKNAPKFIFEAKTNEELQVKALDWLEDIYNRAKCAGFRSASNNTTPNSPPTPSTTAEEKRPGDNNQAGVRGGVHGSDAGRDVIGEYHVHYHGK